MVDSKSEMISKSQTLADGGAIDGSVIRILPNTDIDGGLDMIFAKMCSICEKYKDFESQYEALKNDEVMTDMESLCIEFIKTKKWWFENNVYYKYY